MSDRIIKRSVSKTGKFLPIGRTGENMFRTVVIDTSGWALEDAECRIIYSRPDGITYPVEITCEDSCVIWTPNAYDLEISGDGQIEVRAYLGEVIGKSATFKVKIEVSMQAIETEPGIARPDWVDDIIDKVVISDMTQTVSSTESSGINIFTVTLTNGESASFEVRNGAKGEQGYSPVKGEDYWTEEDISEIAKEMKESGYVTNTDIQSWCNAAHGTSFNTDHIEIVKATDEQIDAASNMYRPIVPGNLYYAVRSANEALGYVTEAKLSTALSPYTKRSDFAAQYGIRGGAAVSPRIIKATEAEIDARENQYNPIVPANLEYAVKSVGDGYYATEEQVGDISTALDELHAYAQALIGGDA